MAINHADATRARDHGDGAAIAFYISGHGLGHLAQLAPIIDAVAKSDKHLAIHVISNIEPEKIRARLRTSSELTLHQSETDVGMAMHSALRVDVESTIDRYLAFHRDWDHRLAVEIARLESINAVTVVSNVGYLPLAAAQALGINNIALSSLNWADTLAHYCSNFAEIIPIINQARYIYNRAAAFVQPSPSVPAPHFNNCRPVNCIVRRGRAMRASLCEQTGIDPSDHIGVISPGGIDMTMDLREWHIGDNWSWLVPEDAKTNSDRFISQSKSSLDFPDLLASCDTVICKPGYGIFTEAASSQTAVLYLSRDDWPEQPVLIDWLEQHGRCAELSQDAFVNGKVIDLIESVCALPPGAPFCANGAAQTLELLTPLLTGAAVKR